MSCDGRSRLLEYTVPPLHVFISTLMCISDAHVGLRILIHPHTLWPLQVQPLSALIFGRAREAEMNPSRD